MRVNPRQPPVPMMSLEEIVTPDSVLCNAQARSKKHCLEILSELIVRALPDAAAEDIFERLIERERLGCTSLNTGVAFPHCRVEGLAQSCAALMKLSDEVEFDAVDGEPVDLVFGLLVPEELDDSHHEEISMITGILGNEELRASLRACNTSKELYATLISAAHAAEHAEARELKAAQGS